MRHACRRLGFLPRRRKDYPSRLHAELFGHPPVSPASPPSPGGGSPRVGRAPSRGPAPWRAAPCAKGTLRIRAASPLPTGGIFTHSQHGQPPGFPGSLPPRRPFPRRPSSAPDPSGYLHALGSKRGVYPLPCPVECRASPHFRRHAASPATATCRHRHRRSGPGATRGRVQ
jgi:hypothetical protein